MVFKKRVLGIIVLTIICLFVISCTETVGNDVEQETGDFSAKQAPPPLPSKPAEIPTRGDVLEASGDLAGQAYIAPGTANQLAYGSSFGIPCKKNSDNTFDCDNMFFSVTTNPDEIVVDNLYNFINEKEDVTMTLNLDSSKFGVFYRKLYVYSMDSDGTANTNGWKEYYVENCIGEPIPETNPLKIIVNGEEVLPYCKLPPAHQEVTFSVVTDSVGDHDITKKSYYLDTDINNDKEYILFGAAYICYSDYSKTSGWDCGDAADPNNEGAYMDTGDIWTLAFTTRTETDVLIPPAQFPSEGQNYYVSPGVESFNPANYPSENMRTDDGIFNPIDIADASDNTDLNADPNAGPFSGKVKISYEAYANQDPAKDEAALIWWQVAIAPIYGTDKAVESGSWKLLNPSNGNPFTGVKSAVEGKWFDYSANSPSFDFTVEPFDSTDWDYLKKLAVAVYVCEGKPTENIECDLLLHTEDVSNSKGTGPGAPADIPNI